MRQEKMKCREGDLAKIIYSIRSENIGRIVKVCEYVGKFKEKEQFSFRNITCVCPITDHYWWIEAEDLSIMFGPSQRAYIADSWLEPIRPNNDKIFSKEVVDIAA